MIRFIVAIVIGLILAAQLEGDEFDCLTSDPFACLCADPSGMDPPPGPDLAIEPVSYRPAFASTWTWPGGTRSSLVAHLAATHGIDRDILEGMELAELVAVHNSDHEGKLDRSRLGLAIEAAGPFAMATGGNCAGGNCGSQRVRLFSGRLFRRW